MGYTNMTFLTKIGTRSAKFVNSEIKMELTSKAICLFNKFGQIIT